MQNAAGMGGVGHLLSARYGITRESVVSVSAAALGAVALGKSCMEGWSLQGAADAVAHLPTPKLVALGMAAVLVLYLLVEKLVSTDGKCYLVDLACFTPPERVRISRKQLMEVIRDRKVFTDVNEEFQEKILERSGLGDETGLSDGILAMRNGPLKTSLKSALDETEMVLFDVVDALLQKTGIDASEVDIVIVSCSCFAPTPSMAAMIVNHFKMRRDILTYNLSGMGCSSSLVCIDLAKHILKANPNKVALIVNHENITQNWYMGNDRSMLVCNCLFRIGGAGAILSNRVKDAAVAKYKLLHSVRTHLGAEDDAFGCMGNGEDADGIKGVFLRRNVVSVAGRALKANLAALGPLVLPIVELVKCAVDKNYVPAFNACFNHFLLHTGGRGVIDELEEKLSLSAKQVQPSKDTLYRFGNTSAASTWYILGNIEHTRGMRRGDKVWQLGFGGGFKCNSAVWQARKTFRSEHPCWT